MMGIFLISLISCVTLVAVGLFAVRALELYRKIRSGQPDPTRSAQKGKRLALMT